MANRTEVVEVAITTDASKAVDGFEDAARAADKMGSAVDDAGRKADGGASKLNSAADSADNLDSKSAQATGALGALSSGFELIGAEDAAAGLQSAAMATDFMAGVGEGLNLILGLQATQWIKNKAAMVANTVATKAQQAASMAAAVAQRVLNAAMRANPIGLIITGVLLLAGLFVLLYKRSDTFRRLVDKLWAGIKAGAAVAARILRAVLGAAWRVLSVYVNAWWKVVSGVFRAVSSAVRAVAGTIKSAFKGTVDWFRSNWDKIKDILVKPFTAAERLIKGIANGLESIWGGAVSAMERAIRSVIGLLNDAIRAYNRIPLTPNIPEIPGGNAARVAPAGGPSVGRFTAPAVATVTPRAGTAGGSSGPTIVVNGALDPEAVARQIQRILGGHGRRVGLSATG